MSLNMESFKVFDEKFSSVIQGDVKRVLLEDSESTVAPAEKDEWSASSENSRTCSYCRMEFEDSQQQREHCKLDWHRYNLKQSLLNRLPITEDDFENKTKDDDLSSISGSDNEKEDTLDTYATAQGKVFLQNNKGKVFSIYKCLIFDRKEEIQEEEIPQRLKACCENKKWTLLMLGGGHFAGAVFNGEEPILHKTFHCYTVRAGQGGAQSSRDNRNASSQPKSAGASLRRYNEQALIQHVKSIVEAWKNEMEESALIIYRASGPYNRAVLFGGNPPLIDRSDKRLRTVPFSTKRATFKEVVRIHSLLSMVQVYDTLDHAAKHFSKQKSPERSSKKSSPRATSINRAKSRELVERPLPVLPQDSEDNESNVSRTVSESGEIIELYTDDINVSLEDDLLEYQDTLTPEQRKQHLKKKRSRKSKTKRAKEKEELRKKEIYNVLVKGDVGKLGELFSKQLEVLTEEKEEEDVNNEVQKSLDEVKNELFNEVIDDEGNTLLHIAAMNEHKDMLSYLLDNDANPCMKNQKQYTAYTCTQSKEIRETLKQFARDHPEKYNYNKAQIPTNTLTPEQLAEKKRAQRVVKKEKEKEKKKEKEIQRKDKEEKERFLKLSDREKRALAAERRIAGQSGVILTRCFLCAADITGKVPFEYMNNKFCTIECLKAHRAQNPVRL